MKDNKLLGCGGCITLIVLIIVCVSALFLGGKTLLWSGIARLFWSGNRAVCSVEASGSQVEAAPRTGPCQLV